MKFKSKIDELIVESIDLLNSLEESDASEEAKSLGLFSRGFGRYSKSEFGPITHKTQDGRLVAAHIVEPRKKKVKEPEPTKIQQKYVEPKIFTNKKQVQVQKIGITDIHRVRGDKPLYIFKYNGRAGRMTLTEKEAEALAAGMVSITRLIQLRIKQKELKKEKELPPDIEKQLKARKVRQKARIPKVK